jgi:hypothetical protein
VVSAKGGGKGLFGSIASDLGAAGHWVASKASIASRDIKQMPGGILSQAEAGANDYMLPHLPWVGGINVGGDKGISLGNDPAAPHLMPMVKGMLVGGAHTLRHPLADPFMTALTVMPFAHGAGRVALAADDAVTAARSGEGGAMKALVSKPTLLKTPRLINEPGREPVSLYSSHNAARRLVQAGIDKAVNHALANDTAKGLFGHEGLVAKYGSARMRGTVAERARTAIRYQHAMVATTRLAARGVAKFAKSIKADVENPALTAQAILHSLHDNVMPEEQAITHEQQAAAGVNPEQNRAWAQAFSDAAKLNVVRLGEDNRVTIDPEHPLVGPLARVDHALESIGSYTENQLITRGLRDPAELADRRGRVAQLVARGKPLQEKPQPLQEAERALERAQARHEANLQADEKFHAGEGPKTVNGYRVPQGPKQTVGGVEVPENAPLQSTVRDKTLLSGQKLEDARARVQALQDRYGFSSPERREAQARGISAREQISESAHNLFGEHAPQQLAQIEAFARQWARINDKTPHEFYAQFLNKVDTPATIAHLPEEFAPLYETAAPLAHEEFPHVDTQAMTKRIVDSGIKLPKGFTPDDLQAAIDRVMPLVEEGAPYRDWYSRAAAVMQEVAKRLGIPIKKFLNVVAITSQGANPTMNLRMAARAAREFKETGKLTQDASRVRFPQRQLPEIEAAMRGKTIESAKRNSYYGNFLHEIDPKAFEKEFGARIDPVTVDRHVVRMLFGMEKSAPSPIEYALGERVFQEIAKEVGWKAKEVQAAAWVPWKAMGLRDFAVERATNSGKLIDAGHERFLPSASDAYELGHAENIGTLYETAVEHSPELEHAALAARAPDGGFTLHRDLTADAGKDGFAVALAPYEERIPAESFKASDIAAYARKHEGVLSQDSSLRIGGWHNPQDGNVYLDISRVAPTSEEAMALAHEHGQLSVFDRAAAAQGDWENAFPQSGLGADEADAIKQAARAHAPQATTMLEQNGGAVRGAYHPSEGRAELSTEHAVPDTMLHEALHAVRQSLSPTTLEMARRIYAPHGWTRDAEEAYVNDMMKASRGEPVPPNVQRLFLQTHQYTPGRGYIPMTKWEDAKQPSSPMASASGQIVGQAKNPMNTHVATGKNLLEGERRTDVAEAVTSHVQKLFRYFNTLDTREMSLKHGSTERMSSRDRLVREDRRTEAGFKLPAGRVDEALKESLGLLENKTGLPAPEEEGLSAGVSAVLTELVGNLFPGHFAPHTEITLEDGTKTTAGAYEAKAERGAKAPAGYKWVPEDIVRLKDLESTLARGESGKIGRFADNVNGAITAATVYFKVGHFFTRYLTNASANIMQGSAAPWQIARSVSLWHDLTDAETSQALSYAGTHYSEAAPGATGGTIVGRGMQKGIHVPFTDVSWRTKSGVGVMSPQFWATHVDAPFRFNSIAFEARQAGYAGTEGFRQFLHEVHDYGSLDAHGRARVDGVLRRADREAIAYDRLNQFEKKYLSRAIWFYPWVKGSTVFTANAFLEHPFKSAYLASLGAEQKKRSDAVFGDEPSYEGGLTSFTGGANPIATDMNTFNPFSTAADLLQIPSHEEEAAGMLNPVYGYADESLHSQDSHGSHVPHPWESNLRDLIGSTPEYQIAGAAADHKDQSHRLFPGGHGRNPLYKNWLGELVRSFASPAAPRHVNPDAGHSLAQRERTGR